MIIAVGTVHGAPGATSLVMGLAAAWPLAEDRERLVVEADPDGGVLASRFEELRADRTLADVAVDVRRSFDRARVLESARPVWGSVPVVVAPPSAEQTQSALSSGAERLAAGLAGSEALDVIVDVGRLTSRSVALPLARRAVLTLLVAPPRFENVAALVPRVGELRAVGCELGLAVVGDQPYSPAEVAAACGVPLLVALPADSRSAAVLSGGAGSDRRLRRSLLWRTIVDLASRLATLARPATPDVAVAGQRASSAVPTEAAARPGEPRKNGGSVDAAVPAPDDAGASR